MRERKKERKNGGKDGGREKEEKRETEGEGEKGERYSGRSRKKSLQSYIPVDDSSLVGECFNCDIVR